MPYLELSLACTEDEQPRYERALEDVGALSVTLLDADADTGNERAILEPGVGETPLWRALGIVRILISWPIYAATFAFTAWAIHRVTSAQKTAPA